MTVGACSGTVPRSEDWWRPEQSDEYDYVDRGGEFNVRHGCILIIETSQKTGLVWHEFLFSNRVHVPASLA